MKAHTLFLLSCMLFLTIPGRASAQYQDQLPVREYTNPDEMITFDRTTPFVRALDIINDFSQEYRGKIIINRTPAEGAIGITIPLMHWKEALNLILSVRKLQLVERPDFYEIIDPDGGSGSTGSGGGTQTASEDEIFATTETREVRINAIFFEGSRRALQEIGVDWSTLTENVPESASDFTEAQATEQLPSATFDGPFVQVNSRGASNVSQSVFNALVNFGGIGNTGIEVQALFSAFEADNLGEILASPTIKVMDGEEGHIQVGQDFSVKQRDFAGNVTDEFFSVGTILTVTPHIIEEGDTTFIHLTVDAERSSAQPDPVSTIINKQEAGTQVLLLDNEATVIAGLYRTESVRVRRGIPILKDLPAWFFGLRYLFGFQTEDYIMRELVILIQASIEPTIQERIAMEQLPDQFEVLENERLRIRENILRYDDTPAGPLDIRDMGAHSSQMETEQDRQDERLATTQQTEEPEELNIEQENEPAVQPEKTTVDRNTPFAGYPESPLQPVPLNFDEDQPEEEQNDQPEPDSSAGKKAVSVPTEKTANGDDDTQAGADQNFIPETLEKGSPLYLIIAGSFEVEQNARQFRDQLQKKGFNAQVTASPTSGFFMVTYGQYSELKEAQAALANIQQTENEQAWMYTATGSLQ